jgi:4-hydroxy-tetrahydrodipicolinate synthase
MKISGVWLPIITPFRDDAIDYASYRHLIDFYIAKGVTGIIANSTTGESPVIGEYELEELVHKTLEYTNNRVPVFIGLGSNCTKKLTELVKTFERIGIQGLLSVSPYYNRPDQRGIYEHFKRLSESTELPVVLYNIPYRTGRNMENETILKLATLQNIIGIKDSCANIGQSVELLMSKPHGFSVLTGEDIMFFTNLAHGGEGGILASAHVYTEKFLTIYNLMQENKYIEALNHWKILAGIIPLLFSEPNPSPLKYILQKQKMITFGELRLPLVEITESLKKQIDQCFSYE